MVIGTSNVFFKNNFLYQFEGFLITVGVLIAAWCGSSSATWPQDKDYTDVDPFRNSGRYGDVRIIRC